MGQSGMQLQPLWLYSAGLACLPTPPASPVFPSLPGLSCALCFPSSWVVWEERTAGCGVEPDGPGVLLSWNLQHRGIYTCQSCHSRQMDQTAFPERWAGFCQNPALQKSLVSSLPPCRGGYVPSLLPQSADALAKEESPLCALTAGLLPSLST